MFKRARLITLFVIFASLFLAAPSSVRGQSEDGESVAVENNASAVAAARLTSLDPLVRQQAAEELARLAAMEQLKLIEGYRLQEKNERVRLALDWALYRMGKTATLFQMVRALDSSRRDQAVSYLMMLDEPDPLYIFLERSNARTKRALLEVFARIGDEKTLELIKPYLSSADAKIARAAQTATDEIRTRLAQTPLETPTRPRQTGVKTEDSPS